MDSRGFILGSTIIVVVSYFLKKRKAIAVRYACVEGHENWKNLYRQQHPNNEKRVKLQVISKGGDMKWINESDVEQFINKQYVLTGEKVDLLNCTYDELPDQYKELSIVTACAAYDSLMATSDLETAGKVVHDSWFEEEGKFYTHYVSWDEMSELER